MCIACALFNHINTIVQSVNLAIQRKTTTTTNEPDFEAKPTYLKVRGGEGG